MLPFLKVGFAVLVFAGVSGSQQPLAPSMTPPPQSAPPASRPGGPSVEGAMKIMDRALETLQWQIADVSKREDNLALVNEMERGCVIAKGAPLPPGVLDRAGGPEDRAKLQRAYYEGMFGMLKKLVALEEAIQSGDGAVIKASLQDVLTARDEGHKRFEPPEDAPFGFR
ncbi:MAG: cytochrome b562 [Phycisphaerales bacterium]|nr:hypothetical protein [Planctomycetota bacterium]